MDGEHYIRGLSDNELQKFVGLYRDMYTKAELIIADDEVSKRKRAHAAKASAPAPSTSPRPSESPAPQVPVKPEAPGESAAIPPVVNRALPHPEGPAEPEAPPKLSGAFMYCTNCGNACRLDDDYCPNCGYSVSLKDEPEQHPQPQPHVEVHGTARRSRGGEYDSMDGCLGNMGWRCCDTDI